MSKKIAASDSKLATQLRETLERYELVFSATHDVLYDVDLHTAKVSWNEALYSQYGYHRNEPTNTLEWWTRHIHPDDAMLVENTINDVLEGLIKTWHYEYRFKRADGEYNFVLDRGLLQLDAKGNPVRIIGSLEDVTQEKRLDQAKDEFISLVSHQLRTPLTVIRVYSEMLTTGMLGTLTNDQKKWIDHITTSSTRLIKVVGDILNVSRTDLGRIRLTAKPEDINVLLSQYIDEARALADEKKVTIHFRPTKNLPTLPLDEAILGQLIHNLLTNAIRYSPPNTGTITVGCKKSRQGDLVLSVSDNGIGIPPDAQSHIFQRFYRAKNAVNVEATGSGLGLYLVKVIIDAFNGDVWFKSEKDKGTTFYVRIPSEGMVVPIV